LVPLASVTTISLLLGGIFLAVFLLSRSSLARGRERRALTWDCGYAQPTGRMQYSSSSFATTLVELFRRVLCVRSHEPGIGTVFPATTRFQSHVDDVVLDGFLTPLWRRFRSHLGWLRVLQRGSVQT